MSTGVPGRRRIGIVGNPSSGNGAARDGVARLVSTVRDHGFEPVVVGANTPEQCRAELRRHAPKLDALLLMGGDGLVSLALNVDEVRSVPVGLIPVGSGNDFARQFNVPLSDPAAALKHALAALDEPIAVDLGHVAGPGVDRWFACALSFGFDAAVNRRANALPTRLGGLKYQLALLQEIFAYSPRTLTITAGGESREFTGMMATVMNTRTIGAGMRLAPAASVTDGVLDFMTVAALGRVKFLRLLPTLVTGAHLRRPEVSLTPLREVTLAGKGVEAYADGEPVGREGPFTVRVKPGALRVLAGRANRTPY